MRKDDDGTNDPRAAGGDQRGDPHPRPGLVAVDGRSEGAGPRGPVRLPESAGGAEPAANRRAVARRAASHPQGRTPSDAQGADSRSHGPGRLAGVASQSSPESPFRRPATTRGHREGPRTGTQDSDLRRTAERTRRLHSGPDRQAVPGAAAHPRVHDRHDFARSGRRASDVLGRDGDVSRQGGRNGGDGIVVQPPCAPLYRSADFGSAFTRPTGRGAAQENRPEGRPAEPHEAAARLPIQSAVHAGRKPVPGRPNLRWSPSRPGPARRVTWWAEIRRTR